VAISTHIDLYVPTEHPCYEGHFPGNPIVPGALLLQWISDHAREVFNLRITGVKQMKFLAPVKPNDHCIVEFDLLKAESGHDGAVIKVRCLRDSNIICKGALLASHVFMDAS